MQVCKLCFAKATYSNAAEFNPTFSFLSYSQPGNLFGLVVVSVFLLKTDHISSHDVTSKNTHTQINGFTMMTVKAEFKVGCWSKRVDTAAEGILL